MGACSRQGARPRVGSAFLVFDSDSYDRDPLMWHAYLRWLAARLAKSPRRKQPRSPIALRKPRLEFLEDRTLLSNYAPTIFTDSNTAGAGSLRDAIIAANSNTSGA